MKIDRKMLILIVAVSQQHLRAKRSSLIRIHGEKSHVSDRAFNPAVKITRKALEYITGGEA